MQARNLKVNSISHVTQRPGVQSVRKTLNSPLLMMKSEALAVLPPSPAAPPAGKLGPPHVVPSVDTLVMAEDHGGGGQARRSVLLSCARDFQHSRLCDSRGDTGVSESFVDVILKEIN